MIATLARPLRRPTARVLATVGLALTIAARAGLAQGAPTLVITHVAVVDVREGRLLPDRAVVVREGRIAAVGPSASHSVPHGARVVDGRGAFLIPGLWDMHVHVSGTRRGFRDAVPNATRTYTFDLLLANGITGVREMAGDLVSLAAWRDSVARGTLLGPRLLVTGQKLGELPVVPGAPFPIRTAADVRRSVALVRRGGADHLKIGGPLPGALLAVAVEAARRAGLPTVGHVPAGTSASEAVATGMRSIEHLHSFVTEGSPRELALLREQLEADRPPSSWWARLRRRLAATPDQYPMPRPDELEPERVVAVGAQTARAAVWITPSLRQSATVLRQPGPLAALGPAPYRIDQVFTDLSWTARRPTAGNRAVWEMMLRTVGLLRRGGARFLAGSDLPKPETMPGFGLHDELGLLVQAGLTPLEALRAATWAPAEYLGALDSMGTVEPGRVADLVLLDANPLDDIANTRRIRAVLVRGRVLDRPTLNTMLEQAAALAAAARARNANASRTPTGRAVTP